jgi:uncharacterized RDD family membrane protein YckC
MEADAEDHSVPPTVCQKFQVLAQRPAPGSFIQKPLEGLIGDRSARRIWSASADNLLALIVSMLAVISLPDFDPLLKGLSFYLIYVLYFQLTEYYFSTSPGKWWFGLCIRDHHGKRPSFLQITIRTFWRLVEANPILVGGLPAMLVCLNTRRRVRFGDMMAGTVVIRKELLPRRVAAEVP